MYRYLHPSSMIPLFFTGIDHTKEIRITLKMVTTGLVCSFQDVKNEKIVKSMTMQ